VFRADTKLCLLVATSVTQSALSAFAVATIQGAAACADTGAERQLCRQSATDWCPAP